MNHCDATDLASSASRGVRQTLIGQFGRVLAQLAGTVILSRLLEPGDVGVFALAVAAIGIADILRDFGLSVAAIQAPSLSRAQHSNLFWLNTGLGALSMIIVVAMAPVIANFYRQPDLLPIIIALSPMFLLNGAVAQYLASLSRSLRFTALTWSLLASQVLGVAAAIAAAAMGAGYWALVAQQLVNTGSLLMISAAAAGWLPGAPDRRTSVRSFVRFGLATSASRSLSHVAKNVDVLALAFVLTASGVGFYSRAQQLVFVPLDQINTPLTRVALPILAKVSADQERFQRYIERSQLIACYVTTTGLLVAAALAAPLVEVMLGTKWLPAAPLLALLAIGGACRSMAQVNYWTYLARGLAGAQLRLYAVTQSLIIGLILCGLPWGARGVAIGSSIGYFVFWLVGLWHMQKVARVRSMPLLIRSFLAIVTVSAPAATVAYFASWLAQPPLFKLLMGGTAATIYAVVVTFAVPRVRDDLTMLRRFATYGLHAGSSGKR